MGVKRHLVFLFVAAAMVISPCRISAQLLTSENGVKAKADKLFEIPDYAGAMGLYSQLLANHPDDANYNYRYGVCVLFASSEKDKALKYLVNASKSPSVDPDVWFYLGKAYHLNYQFQQAIVAYNKYKTVASAKAVEKFQVDNQIAMCKTGRKLLKAITDITVLDKAELNQEDFFRHYDLTQAGYSGQLLVKPDGFQTAIDKKKNEQSIIFLSGEKNELYFSSYGNDESQGKDIYRVRKLPDGTWGKPFNVGYPINTEFDEDYPFMHPNGKVLYFSSKGHNSMGGYDIFRAELNEETGTFDKPVNLDFAINSPDDDIMFVTDQDEKTAWFASNRNSPQGKMIVYHVLIERKPVNMCLIAGTFAPTNGDPNLSAKITVKNSETNEPIGVFKSNETTGKYFMNLPNNGGKYTFTVDHSGIATQTDVVVIPPQYSIKTINQQIGYNDVNNETTLYIKTDFEADSSMLDPSFLKDKAKLDINGETQLTTVVDMGNPNNPPKDSINNPNAVVDNNLPDDSVEDPSKNVPSSNNKSVTNAELVKSAYDDATATQQEASTLTQQANRAYAYADDLNKKAKDKTEEAKKAKADADAMPDGPDKVAAEQKADALLGDANALQSQTVAAVNIAQALDNDAKAKTAEAKKSQDYATQLDKAVKSNDPKALANAESIGNDLAAMSDDKTESGETVKNIQDEANKKHADLDKAKTETQDLRDEISQNQARIEQLKSDEAKEKDPDLKNGIEQQIQGVNDDIADDQKQLAAAETKENKIQNESNDLDNQAKAANDAIAQSKNPEIAPTVVPDADKKALSNDAVAYQQNVSEAGTVRVFAPIATTQNPVVTNPATNNNGTNPVVTNPSTNDNGTNPVVTNPSTNNNGTNPVVTNPSTNNPGNDSANNNVVENENPDLEYMNDLKAADTISNPVARENAKADIYKNWSANIDDEIKDKKQELAGTSDKTKKTKLNDDIKKLQASKNEQDQNAKQSLAAADKAKQNQTSTQPTQPVVASQVDFQKQIDAANQKTNPVDKENSVAQVYSDWADTLNAQAEEKSNLLLKTKNKKDQDKLKTEIADLQDQANEKNNLADEAKSKADSLTTQPTTNPVVTNPVVTNPVVVEENVHYDNPASKNSLTEKEALNDQATQFRNKQDSLTQLASTKKGAEKNKLLTDATEQQRQAWKKDEQASAKQGEANSEQSDANNQQLENYSAAAKGNSDPAVSKATGLTDDANKLFAIAKQERDSSTLAKDNYTKSELLHNAEDHEQKGLKEQQQAISDYQQSGIQPIANNQNPVVTNPATNDNGTNPVVTNPATNDNGTNPVVTNPATNDNGTNPVVTNPATNDNGTNPVVTNPATNNNGTNPVVTNPATNNNGTNPVVDPETGKPFTPEKLDQVSSTPDYKSYVAANQEAVKADQVVAIQKSVAEKFQDSANANIAKAQDFSLKAADENDATKKQQLLDQSKKYNEAAKDNMVSRDSVNEIASDASTDAKIKHNKADFVLQNTDQKNADEIKAVASSEQQNNNSNSRVAGTNPVVTNPATNDNGTNPVVTNPATNDNGTNPVVTNPATNDNGTNPVVTNPATNDNGTNPVVTNPATNDNGTNPVVTNPATNDNGTNPVVTNPTTNDNGTNPVVTNPATNDNGTNPVVTNPATNDNGTNPVVTNPATNDNGTNPVVTNPETNNAAKKSTPVETRLAPGEELNLHSTTPVTTIPVNPTLPEGLVYKVQVGAFRNPISPTIYKNISPVSAETTTSGLTRYTAGLFKQFANADDAKNEIRKLGYKDAFVVAFYNGKRISMDEANRIAGGAVMANNNSSTNANGNQNTNAGNNNSNNNNNSSNNNGTNPVANNNGTQNNSSPVDVKDVKGLFYTVQIGVYRNEVSNSKLKNLPGIVSDHLPNGLIRYSSGKYCSEAAATDAKNNAVAKGIPDAFVCAYYNGKRITPEEAKVLESQGVSPCSGGQVQTPPQNNIPDNSNSGNNTSGSQNNNSGNNSSTNNNPVVNQPNTNSQNQNSNSGNNSSSNNNPVVNHPNTNSQNQNSNSGNNSPVTDNNPVANNPTVISSQPPVPDTGIVFAVQLGAFRDEVPVAIANQFLQLTSHGVKNYYDKSTELTVYQMGAVTTKAEADALRTEAISKGITDAFVVAFKDGKKITVEEALQLLGQ